MAIWTIGVDLGKKAKHQAVILDEKGQRLNKELLFTTSAEELENLQKELTALAPTGTSFRFIMEPTPTWQIVGAYLHHKGHAVYLATPAQVHDMRKLIRRHQKTDRLDAYALAKLPYVDPEHVHRAVFPLDHDWQSLKRGVKKEHKLAQKIAQYRQVLEELAEEIMPGLSELFPDPTRPLDRLVYQRYARPELIIRHGANKLHHNLEKMLKQQVDLAKAEELYHLAKEAFKLNEVTGLNTLDLEMHIRYEINNLELLMNQQEKVKNHNLEIYHKLDPKGHILSIPGIGPVLAPAFLLCKLVVNELSTPKQFRAYSGFVPGVSSSGQSESKDKRMTQAGPGWLKRAAYLAADVARQVDPQLAHVYNRSMVEKGKVHTQAVCEVATHLMDRVFCVLKEERPYEFRDLDQKQIDKKEARAQAQELKVPQSVRQRLRRGKRGTKKQKRESMSVRAPAIKAVPVNKSPSLMKDNTCTATRSSMIMEPIGTILERIINKIGTDNKVVDNFSYQRT